MSERLSEVERRIGTVHQLGSVISAMRGIAAARSREARRRLEGIRVYAGTVATAIGQAQAFLPEQERALAMHGRSGIHAVIVLTAEQGFAGTFSERLLDVACQMLGPGASQRSEVLLVGDRGRMLAEERGLSIDWSAAMVAHVDQAAVLANRIVDALYERIDTGQVTRVTVIHTIPGPTEMLEIVQRPLIPFDITRFAPAPSESRPELTLPPQILLARLVEEYVFAELCEAVMLSFAAENEARMRAMIAARANVSSTLNNLIARSRQLRQEEITNEIIELTSGATANGGSSA